MLKMPKNEDTDAAKVPGPLSHAVRLLRVRHSPFCKAQRRHTDIFCDFFDFWVLTKLVISSRKQASEGAKRASRSNTPQGGATTRAFEHPVGRARDLLRTFVGAFR